MKRYAYLLGFLAAFAGLNLTGCSGDDSDIFSANDKRQDEGGEGEGEWSQSDSAGDYYEPSDVPPGNEGDQFEEVGTNPFVMTEHDPFSTFAADVDSASYDIFRRDVTYGYLPQPASVRLEEFVNYFKYNYEAPTPQGDHPFSISLTAAPGLFSAETSLLRVGIQGMLPPPTEKKPANLVFLVDTSGSMSSAVKLPLVKHLLTAAVDVLEAGDRISIVRYASGTGVHLESTDVSEAATIKSAISTLSAGGSTAGAAGIDLAYQQAEQGFIEGGINHVLLCTDGDFNVGPYSDAALVELIEDKRKSGVTLTVLGFGTGNLNDSMMEKVSNAGNGIYGVIASTKQADDYVENKLLSNLVLIAKDMKIQVEFNPQYVTAYRLLGYENREVADDDFRDDKVDGGEVGAGHRVTALYEIVTSDGAVPEVEGAPVIDDGAPVDGERQISAEDMVLVKVRYKNVDATEDDPAYEVRSSMTDADIAPTLNAVDGDFKWATAIAAFAEILKQNAYADVGALDDIDSIIKQYAGQDEERVEFSELFDLAKPLILQRDGE